MPQVSLYLDDDTMQVVRKKAALANESLSKYVADLIRSDASGGWPKGYWKLFGSIDDAAFGEPEELSFALDGKRSAL